MSPQILPGGIFDGAHWEGERKQLHHNDFHYRFFHYLNPLDAERERRLISDFSGVLASGRSHLSVGSARALEHWPLISKSLHALFKRAPFEAIVSPEALLAELAPVSYTHLTLPTNREV